jgi:biofilm PGA synthesis N-glycosyltransferase PgaC
VIIELLIFSAIIIAYGVFITIAIFGFGKHKEIILREDVEKHFLSIIISSRNEESNIRHCLNSIINQSYQKDKFEVILIDDASEDQTVKIATSILDNSGINHTIVQQKTHFGKKANLTEGIKIAKGSIIITSDADVVLRHNKWLETINAYYALLNPNMLIMPIDYIDENTILGSFQILENAALTGTAIGFSGIKKPFLCNGANLSFRKEIFNIVNGYESHSHISSGDDVFLLEDFKKVDSNKIIYGFNRALIVKLQPLHDLNDFINQRVRWAYKSKENSNQINLFGGFIVITANLIILALLVAIVQKSEIIPYLSIFTAAKLIFDFLLLFLASKFLGYTKKYLVWFMPFEFVYWCYALLIGILSLFYKPYWKGKKIS